MAGLETVTGKLFLPIPQISAGAGNTTTKQMGCGQYHMPAALCKERGIMKKYYGLDRDECIKAVNGIMSKITDLWVLQLIYRTAVNVTKEESE